MPEDVDQLRARFSRRYEEELGLPEDAKAIRELPDFAITRLAILERQRDVGVTLTRRIGKGLLTALCVVGGLILISSAYVVIDGILGSDQSSLLFSDTPDALYWGLLIGAGLVAAYYYLQRLEQEDEARETRLEEIRRSYSTDLYERAQGNGQGMFDGFLHRHWPT